MYHPKKLFLFGTKESWFTILSCGQNGSSNHELPEMVRVWTYLLTLFDTFCCWVLTASSQRKHQLLPCTPQGRPSWAMVASNIKSLNLHFSVANLIRWGLPLWNPYLSEVTFFSTTSSNFTRDHWADDAILNSQSGRPWPVAFQFPRWICSFNHSEMLCDARPTVRSTTHADVNDLWMLPGVPLNPLLALAIGVERLLLGAGFASSTGRWHLLHPFIQLHNKLHMCGVALPWQPERSGSMDFTADWCMELIGVEGLAAVACTCNSKVFSWPFPVHVSCLPVLCPFVYLGLLRPIL